MLTLLNFVARIRPKEVLLQKAPQEEGLRKIEPTVGGKP